MSTLAKLVTYGIVAAVIVAMLTHPAGTAGLITGGTTFTNDQVTALTASNQTGGIKGQVSGNGNYFNFGQA